MESIASSLLRPAARQTLTTTRTTLKQQIRHKATAARTKRSLNIPPHPSFLADDAHSTTSSAHDTIIYNPPSSAASVYHTPFKFLPKNDPRRRANLASIFESRSAVANARALPALRHPRKPNEPRCGSRREKPITKEEVEEMRAMRVADPHTWSARELAAHFDVPKMFVLACCQAPKEKLEFERRKMEVLQQRWGPMKTKAFADKKRRSEMLYSGQI